MDLDLDDPALLLRDDVVDDPGPLYDVLRQRAPVWRLAGQDSYLVSDPALIRDVVGKPEVFSSNLVSLLHRDDTGCPVGFGMAPVGDPIHVLATADPPVHTRHRKLLQSHLSPAALAPLELTLRAVVDEQLAPLLASGRGDVVGELGDPFPARVICHVVGIPSECAARLVPLVAATNALLDGVTTLDGMGDAATAALELGELARTHLDAADAAAPTERSGLLAVLVDGIHSGAVTADDARNILLQLFSAGTETTSSLIATAVETLARQPDLQERLRRDPERIPDTLDDILRDDGPFQFHYRWATADTTLGDTFIPADSHVLLLWAAADRPSPDEAGRADRDAEGGGARAHFAFGRGIHFCIGAPLARLESRVAIGQLLARTSRWSLDPDRPPRRRPSISIRRHATLPIIVQRA